MSEDDLALKFEIVPGRWPSVEAAAAALDAWGKLLSAAAQAVDPDVPPRIELVGVQEGSQVFRFLLKKAQEAGEQIKAGAAEYPIPAKAAISLAGLIGSTIVVVGVTNAMTPDPRIPDDQMGVLEEMAVHMR